MQRPSTDIDRKIDYSDKVLEQVTRQASYDTPEKHNQWQFVLPQLENLAKFFNGEWCIGIYSCVTLFADAAGGDHKSPGGIEFGHNAICEGLGHRLRSSPSKFPLTLASGNKVRTSNIEIIGRTRTNR